MADDRTTSILTDPTAHGFEFVLEKLAKNDTTLKNVPVIHVLDYVKFDAIQPGIVLDGINGTSPHVSSQRIGRDYAYDNQREAEDKRNEKIKRLNVEWMLGIKTTRTVEVPIFMGPNDEKYATKEEAQAAWLEWQSQQ